jgi:hypothetical protein
LKIAGVTFARNGNRVHHHRATRRGSMARGSSPADPPADRSERSSIVQAHTRPTFLAPVLPRLYQFRLRSLHRTEEEASSQPGKIWIDRALFSGAMRVSPPSHQPPARCAKRRQRRQPDHSTLGYRKPRRRTSALVSSRAALEDVVSVVAL